MSARHLCLALGIAVGAAACSSSAQKDGPPPLGGLPDPRPTGTVLDGGTHPTDDAGPAADDATQPSPPGDAAPSPMPFGSFATVDVPDEPCVAPGGTAVLISGPSTDGPIFQRTGAVGTRRFALGPDTLSFMTFDPDGSNPSELRAGPSVLVGEGDHLLGLVPGLSSIDLQSYDPLAVALGSSVHLGDGANSALSLAAEPTSALAVWRSEGAIVGRLVVNGTPGPSVDFEAGSGGTGPAVTRTVHNGTDYTVVWSRTLAEQLDGTSFARVGTDGKVSGAKRVVVTEEKHQLVDLVRLPSGYALLLDEGYPVRNFALLMLNDDGLVIPPIRRLSGSGLGWDLASTASGVALVGNLADGRAVFRSFDDLGHPLGGWICLDDSTPGSGFLGQAGIEADGSGYAMVVRLVNGSVAYRRTDALGTGDP